MAKASGTIELDKLHELAARAGSVAPAELRRVDGELIEPPMGEPARWMHGAALRGVMTDCRGEDDTVAPGALRHGSLALRDGGGPLTAYLDYLADEVWGVVCRSRELLAPVLASYEFSLLRVDLLVLRDGCPAIIRGQSHLSNPMPARVNEGDEVLASIFVPYFSDGTFGTAGRLDVTDNLAVPTSAILLPLYQEPTGPTSSDQVHLLPVFEQVRAEARPLRITCWGDSVTAGGSSSSTATAYPQQLAEILRGGGVEAVVSTVAIGGSNSAQWLGRETSMPGAEWERVSATRPDVVVLEFVNDAELDPNTWPALYEEILMRTSTLGADLLLLEPHFTRLDWMHMTRMDDPDPRPYVGFLRSFARERSVSIASVSDRWSRLFSEGIAYPTLLRNGINHPDDRGHRIYAEEAAATLGVVKTLASINHDHDSTRMVESRTDGR